MHQLPTTEQVSTFPAYINFYFTCTTSNHRVGFDFPRLFLGDLFHDHVFSHFSRCSLFVHFFFTFFFTFSIFFICCFIIVFCIPRFLTIVRFVAPSGVARGLNKGSFTPPLPPSRGSSHAFVESNYRVMHGGSATHEARRLSL